MNEKQRHEPAAILQPAPKSAVGCLQNAGRESYLLRLYVAGMTPKSLQAIDQVRRLFAEKLAGRHDLEIIDIFQQPDLARQGKIVAAPALVRVQPLPLYKIVGDMSQAERILQEMDISLEE
jgi:circadian clock protein KaiB